LPTPKKDKTELQRELIRYDPTAEEQRLNYLNSETPNTVEQKQIFEYTMNAINENKSEVIFIQGDGGSGKTTLAKKIIAAARAKGLLCAGCASTALAATNYENFDTAHGLFKFPVVEENDKETNEEIKCRVKEYPERLELLQHIKLIVWDEFPSNHREVFESVYKSLDYFKNKIIICMGDFRQIAPVVPGGNRDDIVNASIKASPHWTRFTKLFLTKNMRLDQQNMNPSEIEEQKRYGELILAIGEGLYDNQDADMLSENKESGEQTYRIGNITHFTNQTDALNFIYPHGFSCCEEMKTKAILASTNTEVDLWNEEIQNLNLNNIHTLYSSDSLSEVDDQKGILKKMLTEEILNAFNNHSSPPHKLNLKIGDICIILRNIAKREGLTNNTRVRILKIQQYCISVKFISKFKFIT